MSVYIEALVLYAVLFLPGLVISLTGSVVLPAAVEPVRMLIFNIPSTALILYLAHRGRQDNTWGLKPGAKDLFSCLIAFPCLLIIGFIIAYSSSFFGDTTVQITFVPPSGAVGWILLCVSCISTGYLEESFFRLYLLGRFSGGINRRFADAPLREDDNILSRRKEIKPGVPAAMAVSAALFSICHIYEGPWGLLNSALSGILLSVIFLRYNSLHGIALAHGLYNIAAYAVAAIVIS